VEKTDAHILQILPKMKRGQANPVGMACDDFGEAARKPLSSWGDYKGAGRKIK